MSRFALALLYALNLVPVSAFAAVVEGPKGEPLSIAPLTPITPIQTPLAPVVPNLDPTAQIPNTSLPSVALPAAAALPETAAGGSLPSQSASGQALPAGAKPTVAGRLRAFASAASRVFASPAADASRDKQRVDFTLTSAPRSESETLAVPGTGSAPQRLARPPTGPAPRKTTRGVRAYVAGTFGAQLANNALQVTLPLLLIQVSGAAAAAWVTGFATLLDTAGTLIGGWLSTRASPAKVLVVSSVIRALAVAAIPVVMLMHAPTVAALAAIACVDALARGVADTSRKTVPTILASNSDGLKQINSSYQTAFEAGGVAGPALVGLLMTHLGGAAAQWVAPAAFAAIAAVYAFIPKGTAVARGDSKEEPKPNEPQTPKKNAWLPKAVMATALLTLYPLKGVLPAVFASGVLHHPSAAAWLAAAFGVGGVLGARVYAKWNKKLPLSGWLKAGAVGAVVLGAAWLPGSLYIAMGAVLLFGIFNSAARVAQDSEIMEKAQGPEAGKAIGWARFSANVASASLRFLVGGAFALAGGHGGWFLIAAGLAGVGALAWWNAGHDVSFAFIKKIGKYWWVGASLIAVAALHSVLPALVLGFGLTVSQHPAAGPRPSPVHGMPGRLIVVEGLDGSGKSTQLERLKEHLESKGLKVVTTSWNSSELLSDTVKKAKASRALNARTFALMNAADLNERLESEILPALREGAIVLADRWFFTALARDSVRGNDAEWLRSLYKDVPKPDLTLYFKLPVDTAIGRVLSRAGGKAGLSEDFNEDAPTKVLGQNYYAVGRDMQFSADDQANFREFQSRVTASYEAQMHEYGFRAVDATKDRDAQEAHISRLVDRFLGPTSSFAQSDPRQARWNLFDKDPAGDAPNIRRNYLHEKKGAHFYFRNALLPMQERFAQLMELRGMPKVFLHGSPHVDNYAKTGNGAAMVDFDRSRVGPYAWDIVRLMVSISLRQKRERAFLDKDVLKQLKKGYLHGLRHPERPFSEMRKLKNTEPEDDELSTNAYLAANKKWAKEMRNDPLPVSSPKIEELVSGYLANNGLRREDYTIEEAGRGEGSMGFRAIYLVVLKHKDPKRDRLLLNFKQVRTDPDTEWYKNPYASETERMLEAAKLYAPGWEIAPGWVKLDGVEYYVRGIPPQNAKLKKMLSLDEQEDFAYSVGTQLGRAHALSLKEGVTPEELAARFKDDFDDIASAGETIRDEIVAAHERYLKKMKKDGLEPEDSVSGDE